MDLAKLNPAQRAAVLHGDEPLLVLAGAGTGKTTVITYRIANLLENRGVLPHKVLAVTFTNKAAREMRERAGKLSGLDPRALDVGTFHGMCGRLLRRYGHVIGIDPSFVIYDQDDQLALVRRVTGDLKLDAQAFPPQAIRARIEHWKNQGETADEAKAPSFDLMAKKALEVYRLYERVCHASNAVDFGDLLLHTVTMLKRSTEARQRLQARWSHVLVDEYQDTNHVQYLMLRLLVTDAHSLTVVGDDDQSIYRWRGADIGNILRFERDFPGAGIVRLEQNYRSTQVVLAAANAVIAHNTARKGKTLFTDGERGARLRLRLFGSERDEGEAVGDEILAAMDAGTANDEIAVLYRTNAQSRPLEDALRRRRIPYAIYGGVRFYDRREIKDALSYLKLIVNPKSDIDFLRVVNAPARGIGKTSLEKLLDGASERGISLHEATDLVDSGEIDISGRAKKSLAEFVALMQKLRGWLPDAGPELGHFLGQVLDLSGYMQALKAENTDDAADRIENLVELVAALDEYVALIQDAGEPPTLGGFLEEATLATDVDGLTEGAAQVSLMTLHTAKGLEFETVFLPGLEEGLFPHSRSTDDKAALEEERRLCYVGLTRAKKMIHLSAARSRTVFGEPRWSELSRFVAEIPADLLELGQGTDMSRADASAEPIPPVHERVDHEAEHHAEPHPEEQVVRRDSAVSRSGYHRGSRVFHASFGEGRVIDTDGDGARQKLTIDFPSVGRKVIVARFVDPR